MNVLIVMTVLDAIVSMIVLTAVGAGNVLVVLICCYVHGANTATTVMIVLIARVVKIVSSVGGVQTVMIVVVWSGRLDSGGYTSNE